MRMQQRLRRLSQMVLLMAAVSCPWTSVANCQDTPLHMNKEEKDSAGSKEFLDRVQMYVSLHTKANSSIQTLKPTPDSGMIAAHQQALAKKIREARPGAKRGDIFSEDVRKVFRHAVQDEFQGTPGRHASKTIRQGEPLKTIHLRVNESYPDGVPFTTVPPTLLLKFPKLPDQVAYRIVGRDLVLLDVEANLVVDKIPGIFPEAIYAGAGQ
jgi:hypothetical protein